jgi:DNA (cytosine-5)-methyltransferase 1
VAERPYISLYTGAGSLDLGLEAAGFHPAICVEWDGDARRTLAANRPGWKLSQPGDIYALSPGELLTQAGLRPKEARLVAGGPPCQPFSKSGQWANGSPDGLSDHRAKTIDKFFDVVRLALPDVFLLENVPLLAGRSGDALRYIEDQVATVNHGRQTKYALGLISIRSEQYGVPQQRHRIFLIGSRDGDLLKPPDPSFGAGPSIVAPRTAWDAIGDLDVPDVPDELKPSGRWAELLESIPEGQNYEWHTRTGGGRELFGHRTRFWSFLLKLAKDRPSWTIQAEPGPATGPFHWHNRLLSIRELCRLQTIPDSYEIVGDRRSAVRQIGNAVPSAIGELLGLEIRRQLLDEKVSEVVSLVPGIRPGMPAPETPTEVAKKYLALAAAHPDHPGPGLGPGAKKRASPNGGDDTHLPVTA